MKNQQENQQKQIIALMEQLAAKEKALNDKNIQVLKLKQTETSLRDQSNQSYVDIQNLKKQLDKRDSQLSHLSEEKLNKGKRYENQIKDLSTIANLLK